MRGRNLPESTAKFIRFRGFLSLRRFFELCAPDFPPKRHKAKNHGLKTKFKRRESATRI
ncbi:hypothetical protein CAMSH0001_0832 [Campylobacter showae RM3277]|uniref:Uncharacterized protein n=1 Tax=Campylobacter showae RM3277 TaxID=553219 RepID=C6RHK5_9BACT|nr:hypothetical protein CAMSH0001_0832 [Campylobacter showae RM3277]